MTKVITYQFHQDPFLFPAPRFCAAMTDAAEAPLSPKELAKPSMRVVAV